MCDFFYNRSFAAATLPIASSGYLMLFFLIYATVSETGVSSGVSRTLVWLGFKFLAFVTTKIWAKIAYFGMGDDIQAMLLVFMMVIMLYYPKTLPASFAFAVSMHTHTCH